MKNLISKWFDNREEDLYEKEVIKICKFKKNREER